MCGSSSGCCGELLAPFQCTGASSGCAFGPVCFSLAAHRHRCRPCSTTVCVHLGSRRALQTVHISAETLAQYIHFAGEEARADSRQGQIRRRSGSDMGVDAFLCWVHRSQTTLPQSRPPTRHWRGCSRRHERWRRHGRHFELGERRTRPLAHIRPRA